MKSVKIFVLSLLFIALGVGENFTWKGFFPPVTSVLEARATAANPGNVQNAPNSLTPKLGDSGGYVDGGLTVNGSIVQNALGAPAAPTITNIGTAGSTTYTYFCVSQDVNGKESIPSSSAATTTGNASLSATNSNSVVCGGVRGAVSYRILKTNSSTSLGTCSASTTGGFCTLSDTGQATAGYTAMVSDATGSNSSVGLVVANGSQASAGTCNWQSASAGTCTVTATGNITITASNPVAGGVYNIQVTEDSTGNRTITLAGMTVKLPNGATIGTVGWNYTASAISTNTFIYDGANYNLVGGYGVVGVGQSAVIANGSQAATGACNWGNAASGVCTVTWTGNGTLTASNPVTGGEYTIQVTQDGTGGRTTTLAGMTTKLQNGGTISTSGWNLTPSAVSANTFIFDGTNYNLIGGFATNGIGNQIVVANGSQASTAACNWGLAQFGYCTVTATGNITTTYSNPITGGMYTECVTQDATGGRTNTLTGATVKTANGATFGTDSWNQLASGGPGCVTFYFDGANYDVVSASGVNYGLCSFTGTASTSTSTVSTKCCTATTAVNTNILICDDTTTFNGAINGACSTAGTAQVKTIGASDTWACSRVQ